jgi:capsular polysaccharide transport system permease protein
MIALAAQWRILKALAVRDLIVRYGRENIGFVWAVLEPMILCSGVTLFWAIAKPPYMHGLHVITFVVTGYMSLTLFRHLTNPNVHILQRSLSLLLHRQLSMFDMILSRAVLELAGTTLAFLSVYGFLIFIRVAEPVQDYKMVLWGWLLLAWFSFGLGVVTAALTAYYKSAHHFIGPMQYLSVPLAPTFYMVDWLPTFLQGLLYYNPLTHPYEMIREGFFGPGVNAIYHPEVTFLYGLLYLAVGLYAIDGVKDHLHEH